MRNARLLVLLFLCCTIAVTIFIRLKSSGEKNFIPPDPAAIQVKEPWLPLTLFIGNPGIESKKISTLAISNIPVGDSVLIESDHRGCFHYYVRRLVIKKERQGYTLSSLHVDSSHLAGRRQYVNLDLRGLLKTFEIDCKAYKMDEMMMSTSSIGITIKAGNKIWQFGQDASDFKAYTTFYHTINGLVGQDLVSSAIQ